MEISPLIEHVNFPSSKESKEKKCTHNTRPEAGHPAMAEYNQ